MGVGVWLGHCTVLLISDELYEAVINQVRWSFAYRLSDAFVRTAAAVASCRVLANHSLTDMCGVLSVKPNTAGNR